MKQIFLSIQERIADLVPGVRYIDKNWGQLNIPQPPVQWPCCLIDLANIDYSQTSSRDRLATATINITVADQHTVRSSAKAPSISNAYDILDVQEAIMETLEGWRVPDTTQALTRSNLAKTYSDKSYDVYTLTFTTAWVEQVTEEGQTVTASPSINVSLKLPSEE